MDLEQILLEHSQWLTGNGGKRADLRGADLRYEDLRGTDPYADLRGANLRDTDLRDADLRGADLEGADLEGADLEGADLRGANLRSANLGEANLRGANLRSANLGDANLVGANLVGANLVGAFLEKTGILYIKSTHTAIVYPDGRLTYGCETHPMDTWPIDELCRKHEPGRAAEFEAEIRAIIALAKVATTARRTESR